MAGRSLEARDCDPDVVRSAVRAYLSGMTPRGRRTCFQRAGRRGDLSRFCLPTTDGDILLTGWELRAMAGDLDPSSARLPWPE